MSIGKLVRVPLREVWRHEAHDFTAWLEQNIETLSDVLDIDLVSAEREQAAGDFSVDLIAEDDQGRNVIVENQLAASDHRHLGQVITYLTAVDAYAAIWIVSRARMEHVKAVSWLNEATSTPFYLVQVEAVRIAESPAAALFTLIVGPSIEAQAAGQTKKEFGERQARRYEFWTQLLEHAKGKTRLHAGRSPRPSGFVRGSTGISGIGLTYSVRKNGTQVELYIDPGDAETNRRVFDQFHEQRETIEAAFGAPLEWQFLEGKRACRIRHRMSNGGWEDPDSWPVAIERTVDAMIRLEKALRPQLKKLKASL